MLITHANLVTWETPNRLLERHALLVENGRIAAMGPQEELEAAYPAAERLDAGGQLVLPGAICAHTHFYGAYARGLAIPGAAPAGFVDILKQLWWPLDKSLTLEDVRASALVLLIDAIRHGATTLFDHHASPNAIEGSLDVIAAAVEEAGLRAVLCYEVTDRDGPEKARQGITENVRFLKRCQVEDVAGGRVQAAFGLHASLTLSDATMQACRAAVGEEASFHIHAAEGLADQQDSLAKSGLRVVERLQRHGLLTRRSILAHAVHASPGEIELLARSGAWVTHQPRSNMNNAVGTAPVAEMLQAGVNLCLGSDGFIHTMWDEAKTAYLVHKLVHADPRWLPATDVLQMLVYNNARLARLFFPKAPPGVLIPGAAADLIFVDYHPYTSLTPQNLPWHLIFGFHESMVTTTIVAGKLLMHNRRLTTLDESAISEAVRRLVPAAWQRYQGNAAQLPEV